MTTGIRYPDLVLVTALAVALSAAACGDEQTAVGGGEQGAAACQDNKDNDGDGKTDCKDPDCQGFTFCKQAEDTPALCSDTADNDADGKTDCDDTDCQGLYVCSKVENTATTCQDSKDNDGDGKADCKDDDCKGFTFCAPKTEDSSARCSDNLDNDADGKTDCDDTDCQGFTFCQKQEITPSACSDKVDNDGDGKTDCDDTDCKGYYFCQKKEDTAALCQDKLDNDGDSKVDCADDDCKGFTFCISTQEYTPGACQDQKDNDGDGKTDCDDPDCKGYYFCLKTESSAAQCQDQKDNDNDGKTDCDDPDCKGYYFCQKVENTAALCQDKKDNDGDSKVDCDDTDCQGFYFCSKTESTASQCQDKKDNDGDGKTDCDDTDCLGYYFCLKVENTSALCQDKKDNDGDTYIDCLDADCSGFYFCQKAENTATLCQDKSDNDGDGKIDCADTDCQGFYFCSNAENTAAQCQDNKDNDGDGKTDCADTDCQGFTFCAKLENTATLCQDKKDNDGDSKTDCADLDCKVFTFCLKTENTPTQCNDKIDNDNDGKIDCADTDCQGYYFCLKTENTAALCGDKKDNDGDGKIDCKDPDCQVLATCAAGSESSYAQCTDKVDNDSDSKIDCADQGCWYWHFCSHYSGYPVTDAWGATWDGVPRAATTYVTAAAKCKALGGRLPTATELFRNNTSTGASPISGPQATEYLWTFIDTYQSGYKAALRLSDGKVTSYKTSSSIQYRCVWAPTNPTAGYNKGRCHGKPGATCFALGRNHNIDAWDRPTLDYAAAVNECAFYQGSVPTLHDWSAGIWSGLTATGNNWKWVAKAGYWYSGAYGMPILRWSGKGHSRWYYNQSTYGNISYGHNRYRFRCVGLHTPTKQIAPSTSSCKGGCFKLSARRSTLWTDSIDRGSADYKTAFATCRSLGGDMPNNEEFSELIHAGWPNGSNNWIWMADAVYWHSGHYGHPIGRWSGKGYKHWYFYQGGSQGGVSSVTSSRPYRCIWRTKKPKLPSCSSSQVISYSSGKWSCVTATKGGSKGKALVETFDSFNNAWDGLERSAKTYSDATKLCKSYNGRLPTATELYRARASGNPHKSIGTSSNSNYLWTQTPHYSNNYYMTVRISNGALTNYSYTSSRPFRCIWPASKPAVISGHACHGPPTSPCFTTTEGMIADKYDRPPMPLVAAAHDCRFDGGHLPDTRELTRLLHQGMSNGSNNWMWINEPMYWHSGGYGYAGGRWSGVGSSTWDFTNSGSKATVLGGTGNQRSRCIYTPYLR